MYVIMITYNYMKMRNREIILCSVIIFLICGMFLYILLNNKTNTADFVSNNSNAKASTTTVAVKSPIKTQANTYTLSDVAKHNNQASCWTIINGEIYDITSFISSHPAGVQKILQGCGVDATKIYGRVGAHDVSKLSNVIVGTLK